MDRPRARNGEHDPGDALRDRPVEIARDEAVAGLGRWRAGSPSRSASARAPRQIGRRFGRRDDPHRRSCPRSRSISASVAGASGAPSPIVSQVSPAPASARPAHRRARPRRRRRPAGPPRARSRRPRRGAAPAPAGFFASHRAAPYRKNTPVSSIDPKRGRKNGIGAALAACAAAHPAAGAGRPAQPLLYHPLAARLARLLVPTGIAPNAVSVMSLRRALRRDLGVHRPGLAAKCAGRARLHAALARRRRRRRRPRADDRPGLGDRRAGRRRLRLCRQHHHVFRLRLPSSTTRSGGWAWVLAVAAGARTSSRPTMPRPSAALYLWRAYGVPWLRNCRRRRLTRVPRRQTGSAAISASGRCGYIWLSDRMSPSANPIDAALARAPGDPRESQRIRAMVRRASRTVARPAERRLAPIPRPSSSPPRSRSAARLYYFLTTIVALNLLLLRLDPPSQERRRAPRRGDQPRLSRRSRGTPRSSPRADPRSARAPERARPRRARSASAGSRRIRSSAAAAASGAPGGTSSAFSPSVQQLRRVGRDRARGSAGRRRDRRRASAAARNC